MDNILTQAFSWLKDQGKPVIELIGERKFSPVGFKEIKPDAIPYPPTIEVFTLATICQLLEARVDEIDPPEWILHVQDESHVELTALKQDLEFGRRRVIAKATPPEFDAFSFGEYLKQDEFIIGLQSKFVETEDLKYVQMLAQNLTSESVVTSQDDGVSQVVGVRRGVHLQDQAKVRSRVSLAPFRTFVEVEQPASDFIFRVRQSKEGMIPELTLFEGDGGKWRLAAIENIAEFLRRRATGATVLS